MSAYTQIRRFGSSFALTALVLVPAARAACINKFTHHDRGPRRTVTLLTGKLSFQNALALAVAIREKKAPPIEWLSDTGRTIAKQIGDLKIVRPMPVGCDENASGVVMIAEFAALQKPETKIVIKFDPNLIVAFEEAQ